MAANSTIFRQKSAFIYERKGRRVVKVDKEDGVR